MKRHIEGSPSDGEGQPEGEPAMNLARWNLPSSVEESLEAYALTGRPTGGFLKAVLEGDLYEACGRADENNAPRIHTICKAIYNELPAGSWGSPEAVAAWIERGRLGAGRPR